ncbi:hypothetical protein [Alistipes putredinis]|uniref:hypothetical protein n=1 Tax=Alistipes putredinis TaxID=28117 RepID=UPI003AB43193
MNTEEPIAETRRPHPHRKLATNTANVGKRSSARQIPGKNKDFGPKSDGNGSFVSNRQQAAPVDSTDSGQGSRKGPGRLTTTGTRDQKIYL